MTPAERASFVIAAKALATPLVSCVRAGIRPDHLRREMTGDQMWALAVVLAECADPVRLKAVTDAPGDLGMPPLSRQDVLRRAHAEYQRLRRDGLPVPRRVRVLESEYRAANRRRREEAAAREGQSDAA